jgi:elongation factor Ts
MAITTEDIKTLRDQTGVSVMQCKKALEEAGGDMEKATIILQKKSKAAADKKADRTLGAGTVQSYIHGEGTVGAMVELSCETDFVSRNAEFSDLARNIAMHVAAMAPQFVSREEVTEEDTSKARELYTEEAQEKPEELREKIVEGKMDAFLSEKVLLEQTYIKDGNKTINDLVSEATQKFGERVQLTRMARFAV